MRKICSSHREKLLQILPVPSVLNFQTETIYLNSERSEQFWKPNTFLTCFWRLHTTDICTTYWNNENANYNKKMGYTEATKKNIQIIREIEEQYFCFA